VLGKDCYVLINVVYQNRLDSILNRLYESKNTNLIDKEYITSFLKIPSYEYKAKDNDVILPEFDIIKFNAGNKGHLEIKTPENTTVEFNESSLEKNRRYVFFIDAGKYSISQNVNFTQIMNNIQINENEKKTVNLSDINGISNVFIDNVKSSFELSYESINGTNVKNTLLVKITNRQESAGVIAINSDIYVKELYYLNDKGAMPENSSVTGNNFYVDSRKMKSYKINGGNKNSYEVVFDEKVKDGEIYFIAVFDDVYMNDL
jgi:hypothetical protein